MKSKYTFSLCCILFFIVPLKAFSQTPETVKISEIMFYGVSGNNEFVEIFNPDYSKAVDITRFAIKYYTSLPDTIISAGMGLILQPRSYAVIFEGDYDLSSGIYKNLIPQGALLLKINSNSFGSSGMSNTTARKVCLLNARSDTLDAFTYSADNKAGISDEKIIPDGDNAPSNWANSLIQGGTPGYRNSVTPRDFDVSLFAVRINPLHPKQDEAINVSLVIKNSGIKNAENFTVEAFLDPGINSAESPQQKILSANVAVLAAKDSSVLAFKLPGLLAGSYRITGQVNFPKDEIPVNNKKILSFSINPLPGKYNDLVINEIMSAPSLGEPEWIELFNRSDAAINLKNWKVSDRTSHALILQKDFLLRPGELIVLSRDSTVRNYYSIPAQILVCSLPQLNNSGDVIALKDSTELTVDSLQFGACSAGRSLERLDSEAPSTDASNWRVSVSPFKATPGKPNSLRKTGYDLALTELILRPENPFSGSRIALTAKVLNTGRNPIDFRLQLYIDKNGAPPLEEKLSESGPLTLKAGDSLSFQFDYSEVLLNERVFIGRIVSDKDENAENNQQTRRVLPSYAYNTIAVNEIMFMPENPEPEWIEIYNTSVDSVNLKGWTISDIYAYPQSVTISKKNEFLQPGCFLVISKDSLIYPFHKKIPSKVIFVSLPPLNNDKDGIVLKDAKNSVIDSVSYAVSPGARTGYSLERRNIKSSPDTPGNWAFSRAPEKSTPGEINSITPKEYDLAVEDISSDPKSPLSGDDVSLKVKITNTGLKDAEGFSVKLFYRYYNSSVYNSLGMSEGLSLKKSDTITLNFENLFKGLKKGVYAAALISYPPDKDTTNNYLQKLIEPGYGRNALVINEVMFAPRAGECEWLELVNVSDDTLNLKDWKTAKFTPSSSGTKITAENVLVYPGEFIILAEDSSFLKKRVNARHVFITPFGALNNTGDIIAVLDIKGKVIDSLKFNGSWLGRKYSSIERISFTEETCDSSNWMVSPGMEGSTPGEPNAAVGLHSYARNSVVINEIMYEPGKNNSEFIEIYNAGSEEADLSNWKITNENGGAYFLTDKNFKLPKGGYFIIASDSMVFNNYKWVKDSAHYSVKGLSSLGMSNSGGLIHLQDAFGNTVDSVHYLNSWHSKTVEDTKNRSLERINPHLSSNDPSNWRTCVCKEGGTPGRLNSIFVLNQKPDSRFSILPNPFSPDNDGLEDFAIINYNLSEGITGVLIKVFDSQGRLVRTITPGGYGSRGSFVFDGMSDNGTPLGMGIYIVLLQALNSSNNVAETIKSVVVVARRL